MTTQQTVYAQYGSSRSFYGNIAYGQAPKYIKVYGAWPEQHPAQQDMLTGDWQTETELVQPQTGFGFNYTSVIVDNVAIIRRLRDELEASADTQIRRQLRDQIAVAREAKERAFKLAALVDDEESTFILLQ